MPGHRSPDGTVMVRGTGGYPTNGEDDSKLAKVKTASLTFFEQISLLLLLNFHLIFFLPGNHRACLYHGRPHLPNQHLVLFQGLQNISK